MDKVTQPLLVATVI